MHVITNTIMHYFPSINRISYSSTIIFNLMLLPSGFIYPAEINIE